MVFKCGGEAVGGLRQRLMQANFKPFDLVRVAVGLGRLVGVAVLGLMSGVLLAQATPAAGVNVATEVSGLREDAKVREKSISTVEEDRLPRR